MGPSLARILTPTANPQHGHWKACKAPNCCAPKEPPAKQGWQGCQQLPSTLQRLTSSGWKCERSSASIRHQKGGSQGCLAVWNLILFDPRWFRFLSNLTNYPTTQDLFCIRIRTTTSCLFAANGLRVALTAPPATLKWCEQHRGAACFTGNISAKKHRDNSSGWFVMTCHDHMIWHDDLLAKKRQLWQRWSFATELNHTKSQQLAVQPEHEPSHQLHMWRFNSSRIKASNPQALKPQPASQSRLVWSTDCQCQGEGTRPYRPDHHMSWCSHPLHPCSHLPAVPLQTSAPQPLPSETLPLPLGDVCRSCPQSRSPSKSDPWMSRDGCDVVSAESAVATADAHATASQLGPIPCPPLQHQRQDPLCFGQRSIECLHSGWLPEGCHPLQTNDHPWRCRRHRSISGPCCRDMSWKESSKFLGRGDPTERLDPVSPMEIVWAEACHHLPWRL